MRIKKAILSAAGIVTAAVLSATAVCAAAVDLNGVFGISSNEIPGWPQGPDISASTGVLMEAETGAVIYDKGADELRYPASITKLMTILVAVEHSSLKETVTFTETGIRDVTWDSSNIGMQLGEQITMEDCLYAVYLASANEVSAQVAEYVGGTEQEFINMMNERAAQIGCTNTHFTNASGLPDENMYTTARDMALIFREGLKNKTFRKIIENPTHIIPATNKNDKKRGLHTHHPLAAVEDQLYYEGCFGGKTGNTDASGSTLVTGVEQNGVTYIAVVMKAPELGPACADSTALFDYGFQNFQKTAYRNGSAMLPINTGTDALRVKEETIDGAQGEGFYLGDHLVGCGSTVQEETPEPADEKGNDASEPEEEMPEQEASQAEPEEVGDADQEPLYRDSEEAQQPEEAVVPKEGLSELTRTLVIIMAAMAALLVILIIALIHKKRKRRKYRRK